MNVAIYAMGRSIGLDVQVSTEIRIDIVRVVLTLVENHQLLGTWLQDYWLTFLKYGSKSFHPHPGLPRDAQASKSA
jgi:hypothetical protein